MNRLILLLTISALATGCASMDGASSSFTNAQDTGNRQEKEQRLWSEAAEYDHTLKVSGQVYNDPRIERYLQGIMDRLYPEFRGKIKVHVFNSTQLGAFALPNGSIFFNIGLLARIDNEAQLATVLGHEAAHFIYKHSFKQRIRAKNASAFASAGVPFGTLIAISSITGYSRHFETEADNKGYERVIKAGYDPNETYKVFQYLADEIKALDAKEPYFFSTHPRLVERIENFKQLAKNSRRGGKKGFQRYNALMQSLRLRVLEKDLGQDRYKSIILALTDKRANGRYPAASQYYLGEAYRRRGEKGDDKKAMKAFQVAAARAPSFAPTYKVLGMYYMKKHNKSKARQYFNRYLSLAPRDARDREYVKSYMNSL